jgi:hypothetical protein
LRLFGNRVETADIQKKTKKWWNSFAVEGEALRRLSCSGRRVAGGQGEIAAGTAASTVTKRLAELALSFAWPAGIADAGYSLFTDYLSSREAAAGKLGFRALTVVSDEDEELGVASVSL